MKKQKDILLIGNGPSVLDYEYGGLIDSLNIPVVRFNSFVLGDYKKFVGSKTDKWIINSSRVTIDNISKYGKIYKPQEVIYQTTKRNAKKEKHFTVLENTFLGTKTKISEIPRQWLDKNVWQVHRVSPSLGIIGCMWFSGLGYRVIAHGFDVINGNDCPAKHYYENKCAIRGHNLRREKELLINMINNGHVVLSLQSNYFS